MLRYLPHTRCHADILVDNESFPSTPAASKSIIFTDSTAKKLAQMDDAGNVHGMLSAVFPPSGTASQVTASVDVYVANSGIVVPTFGLQVGMLFRWYMNIVKSTVAGTAAPTFIIRAGTGVLGDTALLTLTGIAQTAVAGGGTVIVTAQVRTIGASAVIAGNFNCSNVTMGCGQVTTAVSGTFNSATTTAAGQLIGLSVNPGASCVYTIDSVRGELIA